MAESYNPTECGVCQEVFDDETRSPRNLPCSHHLCSMCIGALIRRNDKKCPFCRKPFVALSPGDLMKNNGLLECMHYLAHMTRDSSTLKGKDQNSYRSKLDELKSDVLKSNEKLLETLENLERRLEKVVYDANRLKAAITREDSHIKEKVVEKIYDIVASNAKSIDELETAENSVKYQLNDLLCEKNGIESFNEELQESKTFTEVARLMDEAAEMGSRVDDWTRQVKENLQEEEAALLKKEKEVKVLEEKMKVMKEILNSR
ncbi:E3 ubiquitin-protein ligase trim-21-like [Macrobrachium nipponense]|uniref:E3 ubiquitin-protein ligase trim-21-like n=1 Tax=Macrobrachium nipponense TaxID=159736 RepID=UPI0030C89F2F